MAYIDRFDVFQPRKLSERGDLLKDAENAFYGGSPAPTPTPTPQPKPTSSAMLGAPTGTLSQNAASRVTNQPNFIGQNGNTIGPMYDQQGNVNALPRGAAGVQGSNGANVFNRSLNGNGTTTPFNLSLNPNPLKIEHLIFPPSPTAPVQQVPPVLPTRTEPNTFLQPRSQYELNGY